VTLAYLKDDIAKTFSNIIIKYNYITLIKIQCMCVSCSSLFMKFYSMSTSFYN